MKRNDQLRHFSSEKGRKYTFCHWLSLFTCGQLSSIKVDTTENIDWSRKRLQSISEHFEEEFLNVGGQKSKARWIIFTGCAKMVATCSIKYIAYDVLSYIRIQHQCWGGTKLLCIHTSRSITCISLALFFFNCPFY